MPQSAWGKHSRRRHTPSRHLTPEPSTRLPYYHLGVRHSFEGKQLDPSISRDPRFNWSLALPPGRATSSNQCQAFAGLQLQRVALSYRSAASLGWSIPSATIRIAPIRDLGLDLISASPGKRCLSHRIPSVSSPLPPAPPHSNDVLLRRRRRLPWTGSSRRLGLPSPGWL